MVDDWDTDAISELMDFRKINGALDAVFRNVFTTELYLKRARKTVSKMMILQWNQDLDIDTLEVRGGSPIGFFNPAIPDKIFHQSRYPDRCFRPIAIPVSS